MSIRERNDQVARHTGHGKVGRPRVNSRLGFDMRLPAILERLRRRTMTVRQAARELGVGNATVIRLRDGEHISQVE